MPKKAFKLLVAAVLINIALWVVVLTIFNRANPAAVLHYSVDVGIDYIGEGGRVITLPIIGVVLLSLNIILSWLIHRTEPLLVWPLLAILPVLQLLLLLSAVLLITVNL